MKNYVAIALFAAGFSLAATTGARGLPPPGTKPSVGGGTSTAYAAQGRPEAILHLGLLMGRCEHGLDARVTVDSPNGTLSSGGSNHKAKTNDPTCGNPSQVNPSGRHP